MALKVQSSLAIGENGTAAEGLLVQVRELSAAGKNASQISGVSFQAEQGELIALMGPGRVVKSRLLRALAGLGPKPGGEILLNGVDLYTYRKLFAPYIGYVPARPALHPALTVQEILGYEARLRLPERAIRAARVQGLLEIFNLAPQAKVRFSALSSFQKYLVSVAVELLGWPGLLLLEAPAEGLEPSEEIRLTGLLKDIAQQGMTIFQSAETTRSALIADKVLALDGEGALAWFGPGEAALAYFQNFAPETRRGSGPATFDMVSELLAAPCADNASAGSSGSAAAPETWQQRFLANPAYAEYVDDPLNDKYPDLLLQDRPLARFRGAAKEKTPPKKAPQPGALSKFAALTGRSLRVLGRERAGLWILLAPLLAALLDFLISSPQMFDVNLGDPVRVPVALGLVAFMALLVAALIFHNEITKERAVIARERRTLSLSVPYALSKVWIILLAALYQGVVWAGLHFLASGMAGGAVNLPWMWVTFALVALAGGVLGLIASSLARSTHVALLLALVFTFPQLLLSGSVLPVPRLDPATRAISTVTPTRYAFESLLFLSRYGFDISQDACWQAPPEMRSTFTDADKQNCICTGENIFQGKCNFPGIHKFFSFVIEQPPPDVPPQTVDLTTFLPQPTPKPGESIDSFVQSVSSFAQQYHQLQGQANDYAQQLQLYARNLASWQQSRSTVTGNAEGVISLAIEQYGQAFQVDLIQHWAAMLGISLVLMILLTGLQLRKGDLL